MLFKILTNGGKKPLDKKDWEEGMKKFEEAESNGNSVITKIQLVKHLKTVIEKIKQAGEKAV